MRRASRGAMPEQRLALARAAGPALNLAGSYVLSRNRGNYILDLLHVASGRRALTMDQLRYAAVDAQGNQTAPKPNYLRPTRYQPPMTLRLGTEVEF